jgi:hypothetical protein
LAFDFYAIGRKLDSKVVGRDYQVDGSSLKTITTTSETYEELSRGRVYYCEPCLARARRRSLRLFLKTPYRILLEEHFPQYAGQRDVDAFQDMAALDQWSRQEGIY